MTTLVALAALAALSYAAFYIGACAISPWSVCRRPRCTRGRLYSRVFPKTFRECPRCNGTGRRIRVGRRVYEYLRSERGAGTR